MIYFRRILPYIFAQKKDLIAVFVCAALVAFLFTFSIVMMLPFMKVMIGEEPLHSWVDRILITSRSGISFYDIQLREDFSEDSPQILSDSILPQISSIKRKSTGFDADLIPRDKILAISINDQPPIKNRNRAEIIKNLAQAPTNQPITLLIERAGLESQPFSVNLTLDAEPFYAPLLKKFISFVPRDQSKNFKRNCLILLVVIILITSIVRCLLRFIQEYLTKRISFKSIMQLRQEAYSKAVRLPLTFFSNEGVSDTISRFVQDSNRINQGISTVFGKAILEPMKVIALAGAAFTINSKMTAIVIMGAPVAGIIINKLGSKMKKATRRTLESWSKLLSHLQGTLLGIRIVKGYHQENYEQNRFTIINQKLLKQQFRVGKIDAASGPILESLGITAACIGMIFASYWLTSGQMRMSDFSTLVMLLGAMAESGRKLGNVYPRLQTANASAQRIYQIIDAPIETDPAGAFHLSRLNKLLEFKEVTFTYPNSTGATLENINLQVQAGQTVAVVGPNGSGKTTLLSLIPKFFVPEQGVIKIDGQDIGKASLSSLREQIGIVTQQTVVFNDTIAANIAYGNEHASEEDIYAASKQAYAHEFIEQQRQGYQTIIGEQGATLSGGQLQRIAIARAILRNPAILIFDEATSQIDSDSEAKIQKAVLEFARGRTSFIIAHRLTTIINADRIVVLEQGKIIAQGTHKELIDSCELYRKLYEMQFAE
ncbi:MAG: ATP-binding cassette domain-containing protein [Sedimentisphaerales bacterium]|nr:ATP-binding cassette domain-containing protein [Sedimentisphaerales bacterium]